jgi:subtilase family serine protease
MCSGLFVSTLAFASPVPKGIQPSARIRLPVDDGARSELTGQINRSVAASVDLGPADPNLAAERVILVLKSSPVQHTNLENFLHDAHDPRRREYHRWLSPAQFADRYGVAATDIAQLRGWLEEKGFDVDAVPGGNRSIEFSGTIGQLDAAFGTRFHRYLWHGENHVANAANPTIPRAFTAVVAGFASLSDFRLYPGLVRGSAKPNFVNGGVNYLGPGDFATIYDLNGAYAQRLTGSGSTIAVLGRSDVNSIDLSNFRSLFGLSATLPTVIVNGTDPGLVSGDELESDLDLEWSAAVAPAASVTFVTSKSTVTTDGIELSAQYAVGNNLADLISVSYGGCETSSDVSGGTTFFNNLWQQAAAQGTSVFVGSGDSGAAGCDADSSSRAHDGPAVNAVCTSPYSICVGGTEFMADLASPSTYWAASNAGPAQTSALGYIGEAVWNQSGADGGSDLYASGGGASINFAKPAWQLATGVPSDGHRDVPDVALAASGTHDPYLVYTSDGYSSSSLVTVGGTSAATPAMAAITALVVQQQKGRLGDIHAVLYALSTQQAQGGPAVFHRITTGNNSVPGQAGFSATSTDPSYSEAAGLGSIDGGALLANWNASLGGAVGLSPVFAVVPATESLGAAALRLSSSTSWTASVSSNAVSWLSVTPTSGIGSYDLTYAAAANAGAARTGTLTVAGQTLTVIQAAEGGEAAQLAASTTAVNFAATAIYTDSSLTQILIADTGGTTLTLGSIGFTGTAANEFADSGSCASGVVLIPGAVCYLDVSFEPTSLGEASASLGVAFSGGGTTSIALTGAATEAPDTDGPLPIWVYALLGGSLVGIAGFRQQRQSGQL